MRFINCFIVFMLSMLFTLMAFAQATLPGSVDASVDWAALFGQLIANPKAMSAAFIGALLILMVVQSMKSEKFGKLYKFLDPKIQFLVVTILGQLYGIIVHWLVLKDQEISVILVGVFSSGGAVAIFNAIRLAFEKPKA